MRVYSSKFEALLLKLILEYHKLNPEPLNPAK